MGLAVVVGEEGEGGEAVAIVESLQVIGDVVSEFRIMDGGLKVDQGDNGVVVVVVVVDGRRIRSVVLLFFYFGGSRGRFVY